MSVFAISDLHLSGAEKKPMDIFGRHWTGHWDKIREDWLARVGEDDLVLIPGDISWAMRLDEACAGIGEICALPGVKLMLRGNHDYWWSSLTQVRSILANNAHVLQNDCFIHGGVAVVGARGWTAPSGNPLADADQKIYLREIERLRLSIQSLKNRGGQTRVIGMMHYPPFNERRESSDYTGLFEQSGATDVVYGHLHGDSLKYCPGVYGLNGVNYHLVSCDFLGFKIKQII